MIPKLSPCLLTLPSLTLFLAAVPVVLRAQVVSEWNTGTGAWETAENWLPAGVPENAGGATYDVRIGSRAAAQGATVAWRAAQGGSHTLASLAVTGGTSFTTAGYPLRVTGLTRIAGPATVATVPAGSGSAGLFEMQDLEISSGGTLSMEGTTSGTVAGLLQFSGSNSRLFLAPNASFTPGGPVEYDGAVISGGGIFLPSATANTVKGNSLISTSGFAFDRGDWLLTPGTSLKVITSNYSPGKSPPRFRDATLTLDNAQLDLQTGGGAFLMESTANLQGACVWSGRPVDIGTAEMARAQVKVTGAGGARFTSRVRVKSGGTMSVASGSSLLFDDRAAFSPGDPLPSVVLSGGGRVDFNAGLDVDGDSMFLMAGGTVNLAGQNTARGQLASIYQPLYINASVLEPFGKVNTEALI